MYDMLLASVVRKVVDAKLTGSGACRFALLREAALEFRTKYANVWRKPSLVVFLFGLSHVKPKSNWQQQRAFRFALHTRLIQRSRGARGAT